MTSGRGVEGVAQFGHFGAEGHGGAGGIGVEDRAEIAEELFVIANALAGGIRNFRDGTAINLKRLHDHIERFVAGDRSGERRANAIRGLEFSFVGFAQKQGFPEIQAIAEDGDLSCRIDAKLLKLSNGFFGKRKGIATIMTDTIEEFGVKEVEIPKECIVSDHVCQRKPKVAAELLDPALKRCFLRVFQAGTNLLMNLQELMRHRSDVAQAFFQRQTNVARAKQLAGNLVDQEIQDLRLVFAADAAPCAHFDQAERLFIPMLGGKSLNLDKFLTEFV